MNTTNEITASQQNKYKVASVGITGTLRHMVDTTTMKPLCDSESIKHVLVYPHLKNYEVTCKCCKKKMSKLGIFVY